MSEIEQLTVERDALARAMRAILYRPYVDDDGWVLPHRGATHIPGADIVRRVLGDQ